MPATAPRHLRFIEAEFAPSCGCLGSLVTIVTDFCRNVVNDPELIAAFRLAAYELTENVVKYCSGDHASLKIAVDEAVHGTELVLTARNEASSERLQDASNRLHTAEIAVDPIGHFDQLVRASLETPDESRLGIGRLRAEADLRVSHQVVDNLLTVEVRRSVLGTELGGAG